MKIRYVGCAGLGEALNAGLLTAQATRDATPMLLTQPIHGYGHAWPVDTAKAAKHLEEELFRKFPKAKRTTKHD